MSQFIYYTDRGRGFIMDFRSLGLKVFVEKNLKFIDIINMIHLFISFIDQFCPSKKLENCDLEVIFLAMAIRHINFLI